MDDPLDRLENQVVRVADRITYEQQNRWGLLWVHAIVGMTAGIQMLLWGSATTIETALGIWSRGMMAGLGFSGGAMLAYGLSRRPRSIPFEVAGLFLVGVWDFLMVAGLAIARIRQANYSLIPLDEMLPPGYVSAYPISIYLGLFALIVIHLLTLRKLRTTRG